jgi:undecaprenyl-diphosphatase
MPQPSTLQSRLATLRENRAIRVLAVLLCLFLSLTTAARSSELLTWDRTISHAVQSAQSPVLDLVAGALTALGDGLPLSAICLLGAGILFGTGRHRAAGLTALCLLSLPLNYLIKVWIGRPRPAGDLRILTTVTGLSFPSGHCMGTAIVFGFLAFQAWTHLPTRRPRLLVTLALAAVPVIVGWTRIYLGAHWFSDVVAGWTVGTFFVLFLAEIYKLSATSELAR